MQIGDKIYKPLVEYDAKGKIVEDKRPAYAELASWCNSNSAFMADHETYYEATMRPAPSYQEQLLTERNELKAYLNETDWIVVKCTELGLNVAEEYPDEHARRILARKRIEKIDELLEN